MRDTLPSPAPKMARYRFKKAHRLLKRRDFVSLSCCGCKAHTRNFLAIYRPGEACRTRLGITVTKRVAKAVGRNRIKRMVREAFRNLLPTISGCWDINLVAKQSAAGVSSTDAFEELRSVIKKISQPYDGQADPHRSFPHSH